MDGTTGLSGSRSTSLRHGEHNGDNVVPIVPMPPAMASVKQHTADEVLTMMNRTPLFMTTLDETDGAGGSNVELEALKALAYDGTRAEIAQNFKNQGNDCVKLKNWMDAREFYSRGLAALRTSSDRLSKTDGRSEDKGGGRRSPEERDTGPPEANVLSGEIGLEEERRKERELEEVLLVNRALCNLEMKNYRMVATDCGAALRFNERNVKAWYRSAQACLALDKLPEAEDACARGLEISSRESSLRRLAAQIEARKRHAEEQEKTRQAREQAMAREKQVLALALKARGIVTRCSENPPNTEDAVLGIEDALDPSSTLYVPVVLLYPLHAQSDFVKKMKETETVGLHLEYILPVPWDTENQYGGDDGAKVECYVETAKGGLMKVGKKVFLGKIIGGGKVEVVDGMVRIFVVPKARAEEWLRDWKIRNKKV